MTLARWAMDAEFTVLQNIPAAAVEDATPVEGDDIDLRSYPGARVLVVCQVSEYSAHGITFTLEDAEAGIVDPTIPSVIGAAAYTTVTTRVHGTFTKLSGAGQRVVSFLTHKERPFLRVVATGDSADTDLVAGATVLLFSVA